MPTDNSDSPTPKWDARELYEQGHINRRQLMTVLGGGMVALAGCGGDGDDSSPSPDASDTPTPEEGEPTPTETDMEGTGTASATPTEEPLGPATDPILNFIGTDVPTDVNAHPTGGDLLGFGGTNASTAYGNVSPAGSSIIQAQLSDDVEYDPHLLLESYVEDDNKTWIQKYNTDFTWWGGNGGYGSVKAEDRFVQLETTRIGTKMREGQPEYSNLEVVDESTLKHTLSRKKRKFVHIGQFGNRTPTAPAKTLRPRLEEYRDASTVEKLDEIDTKYNEKEWPLSKMVGCSMFKPESVSSDKVTFTKYEDHPSADEQNIEAIQYQLVGGDSATRQEIQRGNVDLGGGTPPNTTIPDSHKALRQRVPGMNKYDFNWYGPCSNMHLRRALSYLVNSQNIVQNRGLHYPVDSFSGMPQRANELYLPDGYTDNFIDYGQTAKLGKAREEMQAAGYSKQGGDWVDEEGEPLELTVLTINWWDNPQQTVVSQLRSFGINVDNQVVGWGPFNNARQSPKSQDWDLFQFFHGMGYYHPTRYFEHDWHGGYIVLNRWTNEFGYANKPRMVEVPEEVGAEEISGGSNRFNLWAAMQTMANPDTSDEEVQRQYNLMTQWMNYSAAILPLFQREASMFYNANSFVQDGWKNPSKLTSWDNGGIYGKEA